MANIEAYRQICNVASEVKWPIAYKNDLYDVDRRLLCNDDFGGAPPVFGWVLRDYGTHVFDPREHTPGSFTAESIRACFNGTSLWKEQDCLFYWYAYGTLQRVSLDRFCELFAEWKRHYRCSGVCDYCRRSQ